MGEIKKYFFDTNIIIYFLQGERAVIKYFNEIDKGKGIGYYNFITKIELYSYPQITGNEIKKIDEILYYLKYVGYIETIEEKIIEHRRKNKGKIPDLIIGYRDRSDINYRERKRF